jgi:hypothetical protein
MAQNASKKQRIQLGNKKITYKARDGSEAFKYHFGIHKFFTGFIARHTNDTNG